MIVRENTEGFYADRSMHVGIGEMMPTADLAIAIRKITREGSTRIAESAFRLAARRPRKHVTAVHKANVLRISDGFFLDCVRAVAARYPEVRYEERIMPDAMAALLVRDASQFDVIVATNMFGDILSSGRGGRWRSPAASASPRRSTPAPTTRWRRRSMARRPTSPAGTSPTRRR